eukprot:TRINITY_DN25041_c0_g2_i1.p1 TRINITY_DN25041_c0_g2~~TRINITY_DN25041_c0_g2_i1.p1  ORF type:complete len:622 (-),score=143.28 TRINITY_DN25041_c0_g2_i1:128-1993(-)
MESNESIGTLQRSVTAVKRTLSTSPRPHGTKQAIAETKLEMQRTWSHFLQNELRPALDDVRKQMMEELRSELGGLFSNGHGGTHRAVQKQTMGNEDLVGVVGFGVSQTSRSQPRTPSARDLVRSRASTATSVFPEGSMDYLCEDDEHECLVGEINEERDPDDSMFPDSDMRLDFVEWLRRHMSPCVRTPVFDYVVSTCVIVNAMLIGYETDWRANNIGSPKPLFFLGLDAFFGIFFTGELLLRIYVFGAEFWHSPEWSWNLFDVVVVCLQIFDEFSSLLPDGYMPRTSSFVHALRLVRLVRIVRLARVLHLLVELRTMVHSIVGSLRSLFWAIVLYFMLIYTLGVYFTQVVTDERVERMSLPDASSMSGMNDLAAYCGNLRLTILSLWSCISGGMDWGNLAGLLIEEVSPMAGIQLITFIAFCMLAMANVITGIFVETAMTNAHEDQDIYVAKKVVDTFRSGDLTSDGTLSEEAFLAKAQCNQLVELFKAINVDVEDAPTIFKLIDVDGNGYVDPVELLDGWLRLRGPAKSLDLNMLIRASDEAHSHIRAALFQLQQQVEQLSSAVPAPFQSHMMFDDGMQPAPHRAKKCSSVSRRSSIKAKSLITHYGAQLKMNANETSR